jgi:hypothetical protein
MSDLPVTREFVESVWDAADCIDSRIAELSRSEHIAASNSVGNILRYNIELMRQRQALLRDFVRRSRAILGLPASGEADA